MPLVRWRRHLGSLGLVLAFAIPAVAQDGAQGNTLPPTPLGATARALLEAVGTEDEAAAARFVAAHAPEGVYGLPPARLAGMLRRLAAQSGGLTVADVRVAPGSIRLYSATRVGDRRVGLELIESPGQPGQLRHLGVHPMEPPPAPWAVGPVVEADVVGLIERGVARTAAADQFSGTVLVAKGDSILVHRAVGLADRERGAPNTLATGYHIASIGKMFAAVAVAQLVEAGRFGFDDTLARLLPEYPAEVSSRITLHQLLTHTAGLGDPFASPDWDPRARHATHAALFRFFANEPPAFAPGSRFEYSNGGYVVLGAVIEQVTGGSYLAYLRDRVFGPAGMDAAHTLPACATGYARFPESDPLGLEARQPNRDRVGADPAPLAMGGGCFTALDLFRFARALRRGRLLSPAMTERVVRGQVPVGPAPGMRYGYGVTETSPRSVTVRGHSGGGEGSGIDGDLAILWDRDWIVVVLGNYDTPAARAVAGRILGLLVRVEAPGPGPA